MSNIYEIIYFKILIRTNYIGFKILNIKTQNVKEKLSYVSIPRIFT